MDPLPRRDFLRMGATALAVGFTGGCLGPPSPGEEVGDPRLSVRPGTPSRTVAAGSHPLELGGSRDGILYVPHGHDVTAPLPLFVALHGAGGEGRDWLGYFGAADTRGMLILAPDSRGRTWDRVMGRFGPDVAFLDDALAFTFERCRIDPTRVALAGFSDGASYALSLGLSNGDLFTHLLGYSPGFLAPAAERVGQPRIFISHGTGDGVLPVTSSRDIIVPRLQDDGYQVSYHQFAGGHEVPKAVGTESLDWFMG